MRFHGQQWRGHSVFFDEADHSSLFVFRYSLICVHLWLPFFVFRKNCMTLGWPVVFHSRFLFAKENAWRLKPEAQRIPQVV